MARIGARRTHGRFAVGKILPIVLPVILAAAGLFGGTLAAAEEGSSAPPTISSDKADYAPGETVTLTGAGWQPAEAVHVFVIGADPNGENWTYEADPVAAESGDFVVQFQLPDWFVANYSVAATGASGSSATTTFTDSRMVTSATLNGGTTVTVSPGASITAVVRVTTDSGGGNANWRSTSWLISTTGLETATCVDHANHDGAGAYSETFSIVAPAASGTYNAYFIAYSDDNCKNQASLTFVLPAGVIVTSPSATLNVIKHVINDNGGTATAANFTLDSGGTNDSPDNFAGAESPGTAVTLDAGSYTVTESGPSGYTATFSADCSGTIAAGATKTCTVTNNDQAATLTVIKHVINDNGGTKTAANFSMTVTGTNVQPSATFPGAETPGTTVTLNAGSYSVDETAVGGYTKSLGANCSGTIANGETKTCTITNDDQPGTLTVIKHVVNDSGGTKAAADFSLTVTGGSPSPANFAGSEAGTTVTVNAGSYSVDEAAVAGYTKTLGANCSGTIANGEAKSCTITNDDQPGTLNVIKHVINDNGGSATAANFTLDSGGTNDSPDNFAGAESPGTPVTLDAGSYTVTESGPSGYTVSFSADCSGTIANGETKTCTVTNNDQPGTLIVIKHVINDNGGTATAANFTLDSGGTNDSPDNFAGAESPGTTVTLDAGTYNVTETGPTGYAASYSAACAGSIGVGETKTCTVTNDDIQPKLVVIKQVINDNGGSKVAADFTMSVTGTSVSPASFPGAESPGTTVGLNAGSYSVDEGVVGGYTKTLGANCSGSIAIGETKTCTITNDDQPAHLFVIKHVVNDNGGTASAANFTLDSGGTNDSPDNFAGAESPGTDVTLDAGTYNVTETGPSGYASSVSGDCSGTIGNGETKTCTVTNNDIQPKLVVIKHVINDNGGTALAGAFTMSVTGASPTPASFAGAESPGTTVALNAGNYSVSESGPSGYAEGFSADCTGSIAVGETKTCTVTNNDIQPKLIVIKQVINDNGGTKVAADFTLDSGGINDSPDNFAGAESPGTTVALDAGGYAVTETGPTGYTPSLSADCSGSIAIGETKTCTVTNDDQPGKLTVIKHVINDNGGTSTAANFTLDSGGANDSPDNFAGAEAGTEVTLDAGSYNVTETGPSGYTASFSADCAGAIGNGQTKTCTVTNDDQPAHLIVIKHVVNDNGGTKVAADFTLDSGGANDSPDDFAGTESPGTSVTLDAGSYNVTETGPSGYTASFSANCAGTIANGETKTCTVTNDDIQPKLIVIKHVINDNGGTKVAADFTLDSGGINDSPDNFGGAESPGTTVSLNAGAYNVTETGPSGYAPSFSAECTGSIAVGETKTCTVTNNDIQPKLVVIKHVAGGTKTAADFTMTVTGSSPSPASFPGAETPGTTVNLDAGSYSVSESESSPVAYHGSFSAECSGTIAVGDTKTCTVTNTINVPPAITSITGPTGPLALGTSATITVNFTDPDPGDTHTCVFVWDDGSPNTTVTLAAGVFSCSASHTYAAAGVYTVGITVADDHTGTATGVFEFVVIYDANAGFVTGGGWIMSPAGAYTANPTLSGRANFGFVSKYQKGATIPSGETEFQFQVANFNFHSTSYDWLVVSSTKMAQYKGSGTVNRSGNYGFLLTAIDDSTDKFRIKIWDKATGTVVYDNQVGASEDSTASTALGGGSIVIHK